MIGRVFTKFGQTGHLDDTKVEHSGILYSGHGRQIISAVGAAHRQTAMMLVSMILFFATECTSIEHKGPKRGSR